MEVSFNPPIAPSLAAERPVNPKLKGVGGWLLLFCLTLTVFGPAQLQSMVFGSHGWDAESITELALVVYGLIVGICVWSAHRFAFTLLWIYFGIQSLFSLLGILAYTVGPEHASPEQLTLPVRTFVYIGVWYLYFHNSERVRATFGRNM